MQPTSARQLAEDLVIRRHRGIEGTLHVDREKHEGGNAVLAIRFDDGTGAVRGALIGARQDDSGVWHSTGGSSGRLHEPRDGEPWTMWGGWGPPDPSGTAAVVGGWIADPQVVTARLTDPSGRTLEDLVENGVAIFLWADEFDSRRARWETLGADGAVGPSGPLFRGD